MDYSIDTSLKQFRYKGNKFPLNESDTITVLYHENDERVTSIKINKSDVYADESWVVYSKDGKKTNYVFEI